MKVLKWEKFRVFRNGGKAWYSWDVVDKVKNIYNFLKLIFRDREGEREKERNIQ